MAKIKLKRTNIKGIQRAARKFRDVTVPQAMQSYLQAAATTIMEDAKSRAPVDKGDLKNSAYVFQKGGNSRRKALVEMGFGGRAEDYAIIQHERVEYDEGRRARGSHGESKFLDKAVSAKLEEAKRAGEKAAREAIESGRFVQGFGFPNSPDGGSGGGNV